MSDDARLVQRQAFAGLLWGKQSYHYDVQPLAPRRLHPAARRIRRARRPQS